MSLVDFLFIIVGMASMFALGVMVGVDHGETKALLDRDKADR